jgi:hypothetical protein
MKFEKQLSRKLNLNHDGIVHFEHFRLYNWTVC